MVKVKYKRWFVNLLRHLYEVILLSIFFPLYFIYARIYRSNRDGKPRVVLGPTCLKPITYISKALQLYNFDAKTCVDNIYSINKREDFDLFFFDNKKEQNSFYKILARYLYFIKLLKSFDIFITNFDGGFLRQTKLRYIEHIYWRIGKKKIIVWPYGSDSFEVSNMKDKNFRDGLVKSYPRLLSDEKKIEKQVGYFDKHADFIIRNIPHHESLSKWDLITVACYGIDTEEWKPDKEFSHKNNGVNGPVKIFHCPNHRAVKGTQFLETACKELRESGLQIELQIVSGLKQDEIMKLMKQCDIVAAQFLYGYASTEIEGLSLEKPVISNLENNYYYEIARENTYFKYCPIISASPENLSERLKNLILNPELRNDIGRKGREYVKKYHSLYGQGLMWSKIIKNVYYNMNEDLDNWWKERLNLIENNK